MPCIATLSLGFKPGPERGNLIFIYNLSRITFKCTVLITATVDCLKGLKFISFPFYCIINRILRNFRFLEIISKFIEKHQQFTDIWRAY